MSDMTVNPLATPQPGPNRDATGTLINPQATPSIEKDSSPTPTPEPKTPEPTPEPKAADHTKSALNQDGTKKDEPSGAPEKYEDFKLPDGLKLEPAALEEATKVFKDLNLSQTAAQSLVDFHAKQLTAALDGPYNAVAETKNTWEATLKATYGKDIEPGGKVLTAISRTIDSLPPAIAKDFRASLDYTLAGSNPAFVAGFYELTKRLSEGTSVKGNNPSPLGQNAPDAAPKSIAQAMYPHLPSANKQS